MRLSDEWANVIVSSATLMEEDLIPAFEKVLKIAQVVYPRPPFVERFLNHEPMNTIGLERVSWYVEDLFDELDKVAPEGTYFGAHPGDGALFGFWSLDKEPDNRQGDYWDK